MTQIKSAEIARKVSVLREKYGDDPDAQDEIDRAVETVLYHEKRGENEKAWNHVQVLEDFLHDWY